MPTTAAVLGDAEITCLTYLRSRISGLRCDVELPDNWTDTFVRVTRIGGTPDFPVRDNPRLDIEVWCKDRAAGNAMGQRILAELRDAPQVGGTYGGQVIYRSRVELGLGYVPDPITGAHRWVAGVALTTRPA